jgi:transcriptional regulator NrdR family protein
MNCPQCLQDHSEDKIATPRTYRGDTFDMREHQCKHCGKRWTSVARIQDVYCFNPVDGKEESIPYDLYMKLYRDSDLGLHEHPAKIRQGMIFNELA